MLGDLNYQIPMTVGYLRFPLVLTNMFVGNCMDCDPVNLEGNSPDF